MATGLQLPERLHKRMSDLGIRDHQLVEKFVAGSGPGGQKINKTASCVSLRHIPTGVEIQCQSGRSQAMNRQIARERLCDQIESTREKIRLQRSQIRARARFQKRKPSPASKARKRQTKQRRSDKKSLRKRVSTGD